MLSCKASFLQTCYEASRHQLNQIVGCGCRILLLSPENTSRRRWHDISLACNTALVLFKVAGIQLKVTYVNNLVPVSARKGCWFCGLAIVSLSEAERDQKKHC